jgi:hypothetical protein
MVGIGVGEKAPEDDLAPSRKFSPPPNLFYLGYVRIRGLSNLLGSLGVERRIMMHSINRTILTYEGRGY